MLKETLSVTQTQALDTMLPDTVVDRNSDVLVPGDHFLYLNHLTKEYQLQKDGYHGLQAPPDNSWKHRLWINGEIRFKKDIHLGELTQCTETITNQDSSPSKQTAMTVVRRISQGETPCLVEIRTLAYTKRDYKAVTDRPTQKTEPIYSVTFSETMLFRYAALTFNPHKIHIDRAYTRDVEGYPNLIVQGSLLVTICLRLLHPRGILNDCSYRMLVPTFVDEKVDIYEAKLRNITVFRVIGRLKNDTKMILKARWK